MSRIPRGKIWIETVVEIERVERRLADAIVFGGRGGNGEGMQEWEVLRILMLIGLGVLCLCWVLFFFFRSLRLERSLDRSMYPFCRLGGTVPDISCRR